MTDRNSDSHPHSSAVTVPEPIFQAFSSSAETTFRELVQLETTIVPVTLAAADDLISFCDNEATPTDRDRVLIVAKLELQQLTTGMLNLVATTGTLRRLAQRYLPPESTISEEILEDIAAEFSNVIAGQAKTALKGTAFHFQLSTPSAKMNSNCGEIWQAVQSQHATAPSTAPASPVPALLVQSELGNFLLLIRLTPSER